MHGKPVLRLMILACCRRTDVSRRRLEEVLARIERMRRPAGPAQFPEDAQGPVPAFILPPAVDSLTSYHDLPLRTL